MTTKIMVVYPQLEEKEISDLMGQRLESGYFNTIIDYDCDCYTRDEENKKLKLLFKFRKNVISKENCDITFEAIKKHAKNKQNSRYIAGGKLEIIKNRKQGVASNIIGYIDMIMASMKDEYNKAGIEYPKYREAGFNNNCPEKYKKIIPLVKEVENCYKELVPDKYNIQKEACKNLNQVVGDTCFSTITTNYNLQTGCHYDKGDFDEGFGNLIVLEKGNYQGGYTGFPKYGVAVDVRQGDFLAMDVHQLHGNEPIISDSEDDVRLSIVCYLRKNLLKLKNIPNLEYPYLEWDLVKALACKKGKISVPKSKNIKWPTYLDLTEEELEEKIAEIKLTQLSL